MCFNQLWKNTCSSLYSAIFYSTGGWKTTVTCSKDSPHFGLQRTVKIHGMAILLLSQVCTLFTSRNRSSTCSRSTKPTETLLGVLQKFYTVSDLLSRCNIDTSRGNCEFNGPNVYLCHSERWVEECTYLLQMEQCTPPAYTESRDQSLLGNKCLTHEGANLSFNTSMHPLVSCCCSLQKKYWSRVTFQVLCYQIVTPKATGDKE